MNTDGTCSCQPPASGPDYGQAWIIDAEFTTFTCSRCGGRARPEQFWDVVDGVAECILCPSIATLAMRRDN